MRIPISIVPSNNPTISPISCYISSTITSSSSISNTYIPISIAFSKCTTWSSSYNNIPSIDATDERCVSSFFELNKDKQIKYIINCIGIPDAVPLSAEAILDIDYNYFKKMMDTFHGTLDMNKFILYIYIWYILININA